MAATRSPQEIFNHHAQALGVEDLEEIVADYSDDAIFITPAGVLRGKDGIRQAFTKLLGEIPQATWDLKTTLYEDDVLFLEWGAEGGGNRIEDAVSATLPGEQRADFPGGAGRDFDEPLVSDAKVRSGTGIRCRRNDHNTRSTYRLLNAASMTP